MAQVARRGVDRRHAAAPRPAPPTAGSAPSGSRRACDSHDLADGDQPRRVLARRACAPARRRRCAAPRPRAARGCRREIDVAGQVQERRQQRPRRDLARVRRAAGSSCTSIWRRRRRRVSTHASARVGGAEIDADDETRGHRHGSGSGHFDFGRRDDGAAPAAGSGGSVDAFAAPAAMAQRAAAAAVRRRRCRRP